MRDPLPEAQPHRGLAPAPLLIGVGNEARGDDAAGVRAARLARALSWPRVRMIECEGDAAALLEAWHGEPAVVVVDAMSSGEAAGTVRRFDAAQRPLPARMFHSTTHGLGLAEAIELARSLGSQPARLVIYGIEGADFGHGTRLSGAVACAVREAALQINEEILALAN